MGVLVIDQTLTRLRDSSELRMLSGAAAFGG
jgi:hypothetical protein